jgi:hypothetical protein
MSTFPASAFANTTNLGYSSPLYIAHRDFRQLLDHPNTIQEIINGTATGGGSDPETQYCVVLNVPAHARTVTLYWYVQVLLSASTGFVSDINLTMANLSAVRINVYGRFPPIGDTLCYGAVEAGLSNAIKPDVLGLWRNIGQVLLATGTGSGLQLMTTTAGSAPGFNAMSHEVSSVRRAVIGNISDGRQGLSTIGTPYQAFLNGSTQSNQSTETSFGFPLMGCDRIVVAPFSASGTPSPVVSATGTSVSSVDFAAIGAAFH